MLVKRLQESRKLSTMSIKSKKKHKKLLINPNCRKKKMICKINKVLNYRRIKEFQIIRKMKNNYKIIKITNKIKISRMKERNRTMKIYKRI